MLNPHCLLCLVFQSLHNWSLVQNVFIYDIAAECWPCLSLSLNHKDSRTLLKNANTLSLTEKYFPLSHKICRASGAGFHSKHFGEIVPLPCSQCGRYTLREEQDSRTQLETNFSSRRLALVCCPGLSNLIPCYAFSERGQFCQSSMQV